MALSSSFSRLARFLPGPSGSDPAPPRELAALLCLWLTATACNLFKPFHIDDTAYVLIARWIAGHPLHPMQGTLNWVGLNEPIYKILHPHLYLYLLAAWGRLFGFTPPSLHVVQAAAAFGSIALCYRLLRRFVPRSALWATALIVLGPAFLVEQNMMIDIPLLFCWLLFFNCIVGGIDAENQQRRYLVAALACSAGLLTKYSSVLLVPILIFSLVWERRRRQVWTAALPLLTLAAWSAFNYWDVGRFHLLVKAPEGVGHSLLRFTLTSVLTTGGITILGYTVLFAGLRRQRIELLGYLALLLTLLLLVGLALAGNLTDRSADQLLRAGFLLNGTALFAAIGWHFVRGPLRDWSSARVDQRSRVFIYLAVWIALTLAFYIAKAPFIAARHLLLILPALALYVLLMRPHPPTAVAKSWSLCLTVLVSAGLCVSDYRFALFQRNEASRLAATLPRTGHWWTNGHLGWMFYALPRGFEEYDTRQSVLQPGDYFVSASGGLEDAPPTLLPSLQLLRVDTEARPGWSVLCSGRPARLYRSDPVTGSWSISAHCTSQFSIYRVIANPTPAGLPTSR